MVNMRRQGTWQIIRIEPRQVCSVSGMSLRVSQLSIASTNLARQSTTTTMAEEPTPKSPSTNKPPSSADDQSVELTVPEPRSPVPPTPPPKDPPKFKVVDPASSFKLHNNTPPTLQFNFTDFFDVEESTPPLTLGANSAPPSPTGTRFLPLPHHQLKRRSTNPILRRDPRQERDDLLPSPAPPLRQFPYCLFFCCVGAWAHL